ncbi:MAG: acyltransferase family protein [Planctomycetes bacterium]|nr:acyltransferase family protein [Planctomycetota bacterium]
MAGAAAGGGGRARREPPREAPRHDEKPLSAKAEAALRDQVERIVRETLKQLPISRLFPGLSPGGLISAFRENVKRFAPDDRADLLSTFRDLLGKQREALTAESLQGLWQILQSFVSGAKDTLERRVRGDYEVDEYGLDEEFLDLCRPLFKFLYRYYWRVETTGVENVPGQGRALIVANHSGVLPWDGAMVAAAIQEEHPEPRYLRTLYLDWFTQLPFVSTLLTRTGQVLACPENGERLLGQDRLVAVFPEGLKGVGKLFRDRYRVARFGRGGFVKIAVRTGAPIIPVSVVGAEEIHPTLFRAELLAKLLGFPFFPITPTFPMLGLLGVIPLPTKWYIHFGEPIETKHLKPRDADNFVKVDGLANRVRDTIQGKINDLLEKRPGLFR